MDEGLIYLCLKSPSANLFIPGDLRDTQYVLHINYPPRKTPHFPRFLCILTSHCIPRDFNMISPHFWSCEEHPSRSSRSEHSVLTPHPTRLFSSRFTPHLNPSLPSTMAGNRIRSPPIQVKCLVSDPNFWVQNYKNTLFGFLPCFFGVLLVAIELRSDARKHWPWEVFPNSYYHPVFT